MSLVPFTQAVSLIDVTGPLLPTCHSSASPTSVHHLPSPLHFSSFTLDIDTMWCETPTSPRDQPEIGVVGQKAGKMTKLFSSLARRA
jgi:hypothetical protein